MTGLEKCTKGWVTIFGYDLSIKQDLDEVRKITGYCPEQDRLYEQLNCYEHLEIFARIKEIPSREIEMKIKSMLQKVELSDFEKTIALNLNACQKRKLCLAIALIGDPEVIQKFSFNLLNFNLIDKIIIFLRF